MSDFGKALRLGRILKRRAHKALVVAFDHGGIFGPIPGTQEPETQLRRFHRARVDGVLLNPGLIRFCGDAWTGGDAPPIILRLDWTNGLTADASPFHSVPTAHPEDALRMGVDAAMTFLLLGTGDSAFESREIERNAALARECERAGLPLFIETPSRGPGAVPGNGKSLAYRARVASEIGADAIKTEYTGTAESMRTLVEACPVPVLALGGTRSSSEEEILARAGEIVSSGAAGVIFGRNVFQSPDVPAFLSKLRAALSEQPAADWFRCAAEAKE